MTSALQHLINVLEERNIKFAKQDITAAFGNDQTRDQIEAWVGEYLTPVSLLTPEELALCVGHSPCRISTNQTSAKHTTHPSGIYTAGRPLQDSELEAAITSIEAGTAALQAQCERMRVQKSALAHFSQPSPSQSRPQGTHDSECAQLTTSLQSTLSSSRQAIQSRLQPIQGIVARTLSEDDSILSDLESRLTKLTPNPTSKSPDETAKEVETLCQILSTYTAREIRARISLPTNLPSANTDTATLRTELEALTTEIDDLATMSTDTQFRKPILAALASAQTRSNNLHVQEREYVTTTLTHIISRLEAMEGYTSHAQSYCAALGEVAAALSSTAEMAAPGKGRLKPLRLVQAHSEIDPAVARLLRLFGVRGEGGGLGRVVIEMEEVVGGFEREVEREMRGEVAGEVAGGYATVMPLVGVVYENSPFAAVGVGGNYGLEGGGGGGGMPL
ncbi:hypothetical protein K470DRAFT_261400 [Piedraia hortae CBS 480.64]|uniref:Uncharacterized protein n=1 Tax=Piedraia hortae CBS 480.64 TaxID=1314780 RepID=A0A6A7CDX5_9PEZI|nr:hypothetical protein K470DRAFT_261400 [Piedraia hortae CBS 480.64]